MSAPDLTLHYHSADYEGDASPDLWLAGIEGHEPEDLIPHYPRWYHDDRMICAQWAVRLGLQDDRDDEEAAGQIRVWIDEAKAPSGAQEVRVDLDNFHAWVGDWEISVSSVLIWVAKFAHDLGAPLDKDDLVLLYVTFHPGEPVSCRW